MKARRLFDADATDGYLLDGKYWIDPLITGVKTNADRVRHMTDEELAEWRAAGDQCPPTRFFGDYDCESFCTCKSCWIDWLKRDVDK